MNKIIPIFLLVAIFAILPGCNGQPASAEDEIRQYIDKGIQAAEARDSSELREMIHPQFENHKGLDKPQIVKMLRLYFFRHKNIHLFKKIDSIVLHTSHQATVKLHVAMAGSIISDASVLLRLRAQVYQFELELEKEESWLLTRASWRPSTIGQLQK